MTRRLTTIAIATLAGALFGAGLLVAGMTRPANVLGFLDVTGAWNPSLAFVMGGAVVVYGVAYLWIRRRGGGPWLDRIFHLPSRRDIDVPLVAGSALFGVGWGIAGLCPGPGLVSAAAGNLSAIAFVLAMLAGMGIHRVMSRDDRTAASPKTLHPSCVGLA